MKNHKVYLDDEMTEGHFVNIIKDIYPSDCYIYAIVDEDDLSYLPDEFVQISKIKQGFFFPSQRIIGFINDVQFENIYYFYETCFLNECAFSNIDVSNELFKNIKRVNDFYKFFAKNHIDHVSIGLEGAWLNHYR